MNHEQLKSLIKIVEYVALSNGVSRENFKNKDVFSIIPSRDECLEMHLFLHNKYHSSYRLNDKLNTWDDYYCSDLDGKMRV